MAAYWDLVESRLSELQKHFQLRLPVFRVVRHTINIKVRKELAPVWGFTPCWDFMSWSRPFAALTKACLHIQSKTYRYPRSRRQLLFGERRRSMRSGRHRATPHGNNISMSLSSSSDRYHAFVFGACWKLADSACLRHYWPALRAGAW